MSNSDEPPHRYEVAIVGGGVAGMTLALMCEQHGIDYIALEGREPIDSERGAGVVLQPNSLRILDQLGLLDALYAQGQPLNHTETIDVDRNVLIKNDYMTKVHSRLVEPFEIVRHPSANHGAVESAMISCSCIDGRCVASPTTPLWTRAASRSPAW